MPTGLPGRAALVTGLMLSGGALFAEDFGSVQTAMNVPPELATVVDAWSPTGDRSHPQIILIQDVHRHAQVQENMAALLMNLEPTWNGKQIFVEGAFSKVTPDAAGTDDMSGPELADRWQREADQPGIQLIGIDDPDLYRQNLQAFADVDDVRDAALREWKTTQVMASLFDVGAPGSELVERLINLRLTPDQYDQYRKRPTLKTHNAVVAQAVKGAEQYYRLVDARSDVFAKRLLSEDTTQTQVAVIGGFHSRKMAQAFQKAGRSYIVLAPKVTRGGYAAAYRAHMRQSVEIVLARTPAAVSHETYNSFRP